MGWRALLGDAIGGPDVSPYAAPSRATDLTGLAPAYLDVGELDIFRDEGVAYCRRLGTAGVSVELHVHPGVAHGFDMTLADAQVTQRALADRCRTLAAL
jgi:acetyl esterase/lipase